MESDPQPVTSNQPAELPEYVPELVTEDDLDDLSSFTGLSRVACLERLRNYSAGELADAWRSASPRTKDEILAFYQSTDLYIWALMQWHTSPTRGAYREALDHLVHHYPATAEWSRVCDFGCGVGTDALYLSAHGYDVTLVDVESPTFRFARHRFARRGLRARFLESRSEMPEVEGEFDVVVCFDVFEHLPDPLGAAKRLVKSLRTGGVLLQQGAFMDEGKHPCHLARGVQFFGGMKWHIHLAGAGLKNVFGLIYRKSPVFEKAIQLVRYRLWRATGLWMIRVR